MIIKSSCHWGGRSAIWSVWALRVAIYQYESQIILWGSRSATWSAWALRVASYQIWISNYCFPGGRSATWSAWALRVAIYQYEFQIIIAGEVDLPLGLPPGLPPGLPELSEQECISMNLKSPFSGGLICHLICLSSQSRNLSAWMSNCHFLWGWSATWSDWALRIGIYQYESQITVFQGVNLPLDLPPGLPELSE